MYSNFHIINFHIICFIYCGLTLIYLQLNMFKHRRSRRSGGSAASEDSSGNDSDLVDLGDLVSKYRFAVPDYADRLLESIHAAINNIPAASAAVGIFIRNSLESLSEVSVIRFSEVVMRS